MKVPPSFFGTSAKMIKPEFSYNKQVKHFSEQFIGNSDFRGTMTMPNGKFGKGLALGLLTLGYVILFFLFLDT